MKRGEIWLVDLNPVKGREQSGVRPALVVSVNSFNSSPLDLVIVCPVTSKIKGYPTHVPLTTAESGLERSSYIKTEDVRSISTERLIKKIGEIDYEKIKEVDIRLKRILGL